MMVLVVMIASGPVGGPEEMHAVEDNYGISRRQAAELFVPSFSLSPSSPPPSFHPSSIININNNTLNIIVHHIEYITENGTPRSPIAFRTLTRFQLTDNVQQAGPIRADSEGPFVIFDLS
jgi:hypothetical protein